MSDPPSETVPAQEPQGALVSVPAPDKKKPPSAARTWLFRIARVTLIPYFVVCLILMWFEERLLFPTQTSRQGNYEPEGLVIEEARFQAQDGVNLYGWYVDHPSPKGHVLFLHGNGGNVTFRTRKLKQFHQQGLATFIFDYRGYGRSEGTPNEQGVLLDARAARAWLAKRADMPEKKIILFGESLGGGVAVDLAAKDGARALILESTFSSIPDTAAYHYPYIPVRWLIRNRLDSLSKIADYHGPLFASHGDQDEVIPFELGKRLVDAANEPKVFYPIRGASHNSRQSFEYDRLLFNWIDALPPPEE